MILSDRDLRTRVEGVRAERAIRVQPRPNWSEQLQPGSLDLRLGSNLRVYPDRRPSLQDVSTGLAMHDERNGRVVWKVDPADVQTFRKMDLIFLKDDPYWIMPGEFLLGTTQEYVGIPSDLQARVDGRSSFARLGLLIHCTGGVIDAGYEGEITLEIYNVSPDAVALRSGMRICQLEFNQLSSPAETPYGKRPGSKYQGQRGSTESRAWKDALK